MAQTLIPEVLLPLASVPHHDDEPLHLPLMADKRGTLILIDRILDPAPLAVIEQDPDPLLQGPDPLQDAEVGVEIAQAVMEVGGGEEALAIVATVAMTTVAEVGVMEGGEDGECSATLTARSLWEMEKCMTTIQLAWACH